MTDSIKPSRIREWLDSGSKTLALSMLFSINDEADEPDISPEAKKEFLDQCDEKTLAIIFSDLVSMKNSKQNPSAHRTKTINNALNEVIERLNDKKLEVLKDIELIKKFVANLLLTDISHETKNKFLDQCDTKTLAMIFLELASMKKNDSNPTEDKKISIQNGLKELISRLNEKNLDDIKDFEFLGIVLGNLYNEDFQAFSNKLSDLPFQNLLSVFISLDQTNMSKGLVGESLWEQIKQMINNNKVPEEYKSALISASKSLPADASWPELKKLIYPLSSTPIPWRPNGVNKKHIKKNGKLLTDDQITHAIKLLKGDPSVGLEAKSRIGKKESKLPYSLVKLKDSFTGKDNYYAIYTMQLGTGGYGKVKLKQNLVTGEWSALKISQDKIAMPALKEEALLLTQINKTGLKKVPNIVGELARTDKEQYLIGMELAKGQTIRQIIKNQPDLHPLEWLQLAHGVLQSTFELHQAGFLHRDIKPDNIMADIVTGKVTLIDVGLAIKKSDTQDWAEGTPDYMAPELHGESKSTEKTEVYALGVTICEMLGITGKNQDGLQQNSQDSSSEYFSKALNRIPEAVQKEMYELLEEMTDPSPDKRPTLENAINRLEQIKNKISDPLRITERTAGIIDIDEYLSLSPKVKELMINELKKTHEISLVSRNFDPKNMQQFIEAVDELREKGLNVNPSILHSHEGDNKTIQQLISEVPEQLNLDRSKDIIWKTSFITTKQFDDQSKDLLSKQNIVCIDSPAPKNAVIASVEAEIVRLRNKPNYKNNEVVNKRIVQLNEFKNKVTKADYNMNALSNDLKQLEKKMYSTALSPSFPAYKMSRSVVGLFAPSTTAKKLKGLHELAKEVENQQKEIPQNKPSKA